MTKTRQPSAGNERITVEDLRRLGVDLAYLGDRMQDEGPRALAWYREHEGFMKAASTEPGRGRAATGDRTADGDPDEPPQHGDPAGEQAMTPTPLPGNHQKFIGAIADIRKPLKVLSDLLNDACLAEYLDEKATAALARENATAGQCDVCNHHCTGKGNDRLRSLHDSDERGCHACVESWRTARFADPDLRYRVWQRMRRQRLERTDKEAS